MCQPTQQQYAPQSDSPTEIQRQMLEGSKVAADVVLMETGRLNKSLRVYQDGLRLGCTFITKEAVEFIIERWREDK